MEPIVCRRCGHTGPRDARYCARCGRALVPLHVRSTGAVGRWLDNLSPRYVGLLGLVVLVPVGLLVERYLVHVGLYLPASLLLLTLAIGLECAYLGWHWHTPVGAAQN